MKNREIFGILRQHIGPVISDLGFSPLRNTGTDLPWTRKLKNRRHETVWCQIDKWPWDPWIGTQFTVNFQDSRSPKLGPSRGTKMARIGDLLKGKYKKEAERIQNIAIGKMKVPSAAQYNKAMGLDYAGSDDDWILDEYREKSNPVKFGRNLGDVWLRIVDSDDAHAWATFLASWLPAGLQCFSKLDGEQYMW